MTNVILCKDSFIRRSFKFKLKKNQTIDLLKCFGELQENNVSCSLNLNSSKIKALFVHDFHDLKFHFFFNGKGLVYGKNLHERNFQDLLIKFFNKYINLCIQNDNH